MIKAFIAAVAVVICCHPLTSQPANFSQTQRGSTNAYAFGSHVHTQGSLGHYPR